MLRKRALLWMPCAILAALWAANSSWLTGPDARGKTQLLAHRGVHQTYAGTDRTGDTCKAPRIAPIAHPFIENTLPSMRAAVDAGADVIELDVHLTPDGHFAVFHDWTLDCQTNGTGVTEETNFSTLKALDVGYGFSDDGGNTYPLRGTGVGLMPSLRQVLNADLDTTFLINFKSRRPEEGAALAQMLGNAKNRSQVFGVYGGAAPTQKAMHMVPGLKGYDRQSLMSCLKAYLAIGWSGYVPKICRDRLVAAPISHAPWLWGWPHRFTKRMKRAGTDVILLGPWDGSGFSSGIDTEQQLKKVPNGFDGYIWTNRIEKVGPLLNTQQR